MKSLATSSVFTVQTINNVDPATNLHLKLVIVLALKKIFLKIAGQEEHKDVTSAILDSISQKKVNATKCLKMV